MPRPTPYPTKPGQESVWDYPRPPALEKTTNHLRVLYSGAVIADTNEGFRVLETSHPPNYYFPREDVEMQFLIPSERTTHCEWKGKGSYFHVRVGEAVAENAVWFYDQPTPRFALIKNYLAFYAGKMTLCLVNDEVVIPQPGSFYGGWISPTIIGPFKGVDGSWGW